MSGRCFLLLVFFAAIGAERCPPIFGESECPIGLNCVEGKCSGEGASDDCDVLTCPENTRCVSGRCYNVENLPCNRNVLVSENAAKAIVSDCGSKGRCMNGRCVVDRCSEVSCGLMELCIDGTCTNITERFCLASFDCGPSMECVGNKCQDTGILTKPFCSCDPDQVCNADGSCSRRPKCSRLFCPNGHVCVDGFCSSTDSLQCSTDLECGPGSVCTGGTCRADPCSSKRCPVDHKCRAGECRHLQGLLCNGECPHPYECLNGRCTRNECAKKVCQLGETCENGLCVRVEGRFCTLAVRDCAERFTCEKNACKDQLKSVEKRK